MKIAILSFVPLGKKALYEEIRLKNEAYSLGHSARILRSCRCQMFFDKHHPNVFYDGKIFPSYDVVIPRVRLLQEVDTGVSVIKQIQLMKIPVFNRYLPVTRAKNKLRTLQMLDDLGLAIPRTMVVHDLQYVDEAIKRVGGPPVILRRATGSYGAGVVIAESKRAVHSTIDSMVSHGAWNKILIIQEYVKEAKGMDTRVFVVAGRIIAAMNRKARRGEFRSNLELGGQAMEAVLTDAEKEIALKAVKTLELQVAGVDLIMTKEGPAVLEVNANPGFEGLEEVTKVNVAREIILEAVKYGKRLKIKK